MSSLRFYLLTALVILTVTHPTLCGPAKSMKGRKVVLMSMDGFRYDYLTKTDTPNFDALIASGVTVPYVNNTFVTQTFPCHYTIATGNYEESHGIVLNTMYDPVFKSKFDKRNKESRWWNGAEPIWINAVKSGLKVGVFFWPGSETKLEGYLPTSYEAYDKNVPFKDRVDTVVTEWLSKADYDFGVIYFHEPDATGHKYGPDGPEMVEAIKRMDGILGYFMEKLKNEALQENVDLIVTSDHGMTAIDPQKKAIIISDYVNHTLLLDFLGGGAVAHLRPQEGKAEELAKKLSGIDHLTVYLKDEIPDRYHYRNNRRVMPVVVVADEGWTVGPARLPYFDKGNHGYSTDYDSMKPIFVASGPSFKKNVEGEPIKSVDIYPLMCHLLNIDPAPNNGSFDRVQNLLFTGGGNNAVTINTISFNCLTAVMVMLSILFKY